MRRLSSRRFSRRLVLAVFAPLLSFRVLDCLRAVSIGDSTGRSARQRERPQRQVTHKPGTQRFQGIRERASAAGEVFKREDVPVSLGIIIDDSGSMMSKRTRVEAAALAWSVRSNPQDEVFIVNFNDEAYPGRAFHERCQKMEQGLTRIDSRGGTAMRDAINMSLDYIKKEGKRDKKVLLVITDGNDNASGTSLEKVVARSNQSDVLVYSIGLLRKKRSVRLPRQACAN